MSLPLVSVIVPIYNCEPYIVECTENILTQTYQNIQIVLVDDGSKDNSYDICKKITDSRVELFQKENGGASTARNYGLKKAKGDYILFVDSDDYLEKNAVEVLVENALKTGVDCVFYEADNYSDDSTLEIKVGGLLQKNDYPITDGESLVTKLISNHDYHAVPFLYFAKKELYENGVSFKEGIMFEDELFSFELLCACKSVQCLKEVLYHRRVRNDSVMMSKGREKFRFFSASSVFDSLYDIYDRDRENSVKRSFLVRFVFLWDDYRRAYKKKDVESQTTEKRIRYVIKKNDYFGSKEVKLRYKSYNLWLADKAIKKIF